MVLKQVDIDYLNSLTGVWLKRYQLLYKQARTRYEPELAMQIAHDALRRWQETGRI